MAYVSVCLFCEIEKMNDVEITKYPLTVLIEHKWRFLVLFLLVFFFTLLPLSFIGFVPQSIDASFGKSTEVVAIESATPMRIVIHRIGVDVNIENPESREIAVLDEALKGGVVHYPGTGTLEEDANIFLFGHSSYLPIVFNKNYQAFNGLQKLQEGDEILVQSDTTEYVYRVSSVRLAKADEALIDLRKGVRKLTLSTCNSFGDIGERYIVEALFVESNLFTS